MPIYVSFWPLIGDKIWTSSQLMPTHAKEKSQPNGAPEPPIKERKMVDSAEKANDANEKPTNHHNISRTMLD